MFVGWPLVNDIIGLRVALLIVDNTIVVFFNEAVFADIPLVDVVMLVVVVLVEMVVVVLVLVEVVVVFC